MYESLVEPCYKTATTRTEATHDGHSKKTGGEYTTSKSNP